MSLKRVFKGLKFHYKVEGQEKMLMDKYMTIEDFLSTEFPKNNNPLSPKPDTEIFDIKWNAHLVAINKDVKTISDLKNILSSGKCYITNTRITTSKASLYQRNYIRKSIHSIEEVREATKDVLFNEDKTKILFDGDMIKGNSQRYQTFFTKGCKCVKCGIEGKYFAKEKNRGDVSWHLNLWTVDEDGNEVLMTKDHIIPRSKGGENKLSNYQTMCVICNKEKGNCLEEELNS